MADAMLSSPDPLNDSPPFQSPQKTRRRASRASVSLPSQGSSPKKQTFDLDVGNRISPQKIRVTVEAGDDSDIENTYSHYIQSRDNSPSKSRSRAPKNRRRERTTTTTVPVKGLSDSEDQIQHVATPKRGRGRPRKSIGTPVPAKKRGRATTPVRKPNTRRKSIGESEVDESEDGDFQIGKGVEIGRGKGSRSRSTKTATRKSTPASKQPVSNHVISSTTGKKGRGRRKSILAEDVAILEDIINEDDVQIDGPGEPAEMSGALQPIDSNEQYPSSAYSTIRSTATIEDAHPDIVLARFNPGDETPRGPGWSSPRIVEVPVPSSPLQQNTSRRSLSTRYSDDREDSVAMVSVPPSDRNRSEEQLYEDEDEDEARDGVGEMREFDTILESEEFSMISVDSVPSLREHLSSSPRDQECEPAQPLRNKNLLSVQEAEYDDSFSEIPEEVLEAATPGRKAPNPQLLSVQNSRMDDSFSSIPPEILEAATPARKTQVSKFMSSNISKLENPSSLKANNVRERTSPIRPSRDSLPAQNPQNEDFYEDSFSAIPAEVLEAATPAPKATAKPSSSVQTGSKSTGLKPSVSKLNLSHSQTSSNPRPLTPDETPSPPVDQSHQDTSRSIVKSSSHSSRYTVRETTEIESSMVQSQIPSSPPSIAPRRYTYTAHLRKIRQLHPDSIETPSIVFSSPTLPPRIQQQLPNQGLISEQSLRPALSPIARAGRVLQDIAVPSSPRERSQSLGSPFKSPISDRNSSSLARETQASSSRNDRAIGPDDPFRNNSNATNQHSPSPDERQEYILELPSQRQRGLSDSRLSTIRSGAGCVRSDSAMSWQAEEEIPLSGSALSTDNNVNSAVGARAPLSAASGNSKTRDQEDAAERAAVSRRIESASAGDVIVIGSDEERQYSGGADEDEDLDLLLETMNSSSPVVSPYQRPESPKEVVEKPRRSKIPSPWRKNSKRLVYSDELSSPNLATGLGLGKTLVNNTASNPVTARRAFTSHQQSDDTGDADLSGWQIPEKSNFQRRPKESGGLDLSALLGNSPAKKLPVLSASSRNNSSQLERNSVRSQSREVSRESSIESRLGISREQRSQGSDAQRKGYGSTSRTESRGEESFAPIPQKQGFTPKPHDKLSQEKSFSPISQKQRFTPMPRNELNEQKSFAPIPQKQGFTPRPRSEIASSPVKQPAPRLFSQAPKDPISSQPGLSSSTQPLASSSPSKHSLQSQAQPTTEPFSPNYLNDTTSSLTSNADKENQTTINRTLKWTKTIHLSTSESHTPTLISPTKSCLRSPLKTPSAPSSHNLSPSKAVTFASSSPSPASPSPLSTTTWSNAHWLLLDTILQSWKPEHGKGKTGRRNSTRVVSRLLGREIKDENGERLVLEQWHLEATDEFRERVGGWEEKGVAMRVFALLIGEEKRRVRVVKGKGRVVEEGGKVVV